MSARLSRLGVAAFACLILLASASPAAADTGDPLTYFGGPVAHSMTGVVVDWGSSVNSIYTNETTGDPGLIKYLASASGATADIGGVTAQYMDSSGHNAANSVSYGQQYQITPSVPSGTIQDSAVQSELVAQIGAGHLPRPAANGLSTIYLVLFPAGDSICFSDGSCSGQVFCAYHGSTQLGDGTHVLYAVLPDNTTGPMTQGCGTAQTLFRDQTSYTSHEWSETITDPLVAEANTNGPPLAWYDANCPSQGSSCGEIGDKCNQLTGTNGGWTVQLEWSNLDSHCVGSESGFSSPTATFTPPGNPQPSQQVSFDGSGSTDPAGDRASAGYGGSSYSIPPGIASYDWNWGDATPHGHGATAGHTFALAGNYQVSLTVTDNLGFTATVTKQVTVAGASQAAPVVTTGGAAAISDQGATLNGSINPNGQVVSYRFAYGTSAGNLDQSTSLAQGPTGQAPTPVSTAISSLSASTTYYYRLDVIAQGQTYSGSVQSFATNAGVTPPPQVPVAGTGAATQITTTGARLDGTINAGGPAAVSYHFSYGTSSTGLSHATSETAGPAGTTAVPVASSITGLSQHAQYFYRLDVDYNGHTYSGAVRSFVALAVQPTVTTSGASSIASNKATVKGTVNPHGNQTSYHVEYGTNTGYGHGSPIASAGAGSASVSVSVALAGLRPRTVYHYRFVASSAGGTVVGADATFKTATSPPPAPRLSFSVASGQSLRSALVHHLYVNFSCSKACTAQFAVTPALTGFIRAAASPLALARGSGRLRARSAGRVKLNFTSSARGWLRGRKRIKLVIWADATGSGGSTSAPATATVTLGR